MPAFRGEIAPDNDYDVVIDDLHKDETPDTPITDATITATLADSSGDAVTGANAVSITHKGTGNYRGTLQPSGLTDGARYTLTVTCSNYRAKWTALVTCRTRHFSE